VYANPVRRAEVLAATGHGYWTAAVAVAALAAALSAVWSAQRGVRSEHASVRRGARPGPTGPLVRLVTLVPVQLALFTAVEVTERAAAHASVASFLHSNELRLGLVLQVALALLLVATLRLIEQMGSDLAAPAVTSTVSQTSDWKKSRVNVLNRWYSAPRRPPASAARNRTALPRKARFSLAAVRADGVVASTLFASSRSAAKWFLPPRK